MYSRSRLTAHQSKKFNTHKQVRTYLSGFVVVASAFIFLFLISKVTYISALNIKNIAVNGIGEEIGGHIRTEANRILSGSYLGLFSRSNVFLYPHDRLVANIESSLPEVLSLRISRKGFSGLNIDVVPKNPSARVCTSLPEFTDDHELKIEGGCYLVDWSGQIFDIANASSSVPKNLYFIPRIVENVTNVSSLILSNVASTSEFMALQSFYEGARGGGLDPQFVLVKENGEYEMFANDVIIYFNNLRPVEEQLNNLISFWKNSKNRPSQDLEYIDVRYGSNVFYRAMQ